jgi:hypothetical protein
MFRYKIIFTFLICSAILFACKSEENSGGNKTIVMNDASTFVTELDSTKTKNLVKDISISNTKPTNTINEVMHDVDSSKKATDLKNTNNTALINGSKLAEKGIQIVIADNVTKSGDHYIFTTGKVSENLQIQVVNLTDVKVQQRIYTKLQVALNPDAPMALPELKEYCNAWVTLPGNNNLFAGVSKADMKFRTIDNKTISLAIENLMRKQGIKQNKIKPELEKIKLVKSANDAPCQIIPFSTEIKISGVLNGKKVSTVFVIGV